MADQQDDRPIAAVRVPRRFFRGRDAAARQQDLQRRLGPLFGGKRLFHFDQGTFSFVSPDPAALVHFPATHPRAGEERYDWSEGEGGVMHGRIRPDEPPEEA